MSAIEVVDDGMITVRVKDASGEGGQDKPIDLYVMGHTISEMGKDSDAKDEPYSVWLKRAQQLLADNGITGLSGKAADELVTAILKRFAPEQKKEEATPQPA